MNSYDLSDLAQLLQAGGLSDSRGSFKDAAGGLAGQIIKGSGPDAGTIASQLVMGLLSDGGNKSEMGMDNQEASNGSAKGALGGLARQIIEGSGPDAGTIASGSLASSSLFS
tara:strand:+ start:268 stop:603 length:336 start_codon:yes stop_codon:yes gene_type:complete